MLDTQNLKKIYNYKIKNKPGFDKGINFKSSLDRIEQRFKSIEFKTEKLAYGRLKLQKGLPMFGDYDGDKKLNVFDCHPRDINKQGIIDKTVNLIKGKGFVDSTQQGVSYNIVPEPATVDYGFTRKKATMKFQPDTYTYEQPIERTQEIEVLEPQETLEQEDKKYTEIVEQQTEPAKEPLWEKIAYGTGILKTPETIRDIEVAKAQAKILAQTKIQEKTGVRKRDRSIRDRRYRDYYDDPINAPRQFIRDLYSGIYGQPQQTQRVEMGIGVGRNLKDNLAIMSSLKTGQSFKTQLEEPKETYRDVSLPVPGQSRIIASEPIQRSEPVKGTVGKQWSPYSKRPVSYTRGPYGKRKIKQELTG